MPKLINEFLENDRNKFFYERVKEGRIQEILDEQYPPLKKDNLILKEGQFGIDGVAFMVISKESLMQHHYTEEDSDKLLTRVMMAGGLMTAQVREDVQEYLHIMYRHLGYSIVFTHACVLIHEQFAKELPHDEYKAVVLHEMGHVYYKHTVGMKTEGPYDLHFDVEKEKQADLHSIAEGTSPTVLKRAIMTCLRISLRMQKLSLLDELLTRISVHEENKERFEYLDAFEKRLGTRNESKKL